MARVRLVYPTCDEESGGQLVRLSPDLFSGEIWEGGQAFEGQRAAVAHVVGDGQRAEVVWQGVQGQCRSVRHVPSGSVSPLIERGWMCVSSNWGIGGTLGTCRLRHSSLRRVL